jgi:ATP-dependent helicase HrpA
MCLHYANVPASPYKEAAKRADITPCEQLKTDLIHVAFDRCFLLGLPPIRSRDQFEKRLADKRGELISTAAELAQSIAKPLAEYHAIAKRLGSNIPLAAINGVNDIREQLGFLIYQGFVHDTPDQALKRLPVYFQAAGSRLDKLLTDPAKDRQRMAEIAPYWQRFTSNLNRMHSPAFRHYRWMLEEFRISVFAQELKTAYPVSGKRLDKQWQEC